MTEFSAAPLKPEMAFDDLARVDIRLGTIVRVEDVEGSKKLVRLVVDLGEPRHRTILAGMKQERTDPRETEGRQTLFVVNLAPRRMAGEMSEGMLLDLGYADGLLPALVLPERSLPPGTRAG